MTMSEIEAANGQPEHDAQHFLHDMLIEFLRAISATDPIGRDAKVDYSFWRALDALGDVPSDKRIGVSLKAFSEAIDRAKNYERSTDVLSAADRVATSAGKVLAERISGSGTQLTLAESRHHEALRTWYDYFDSNRRRAQRGIY
jgi:hypothetical protein